MLSGAPAKFIVGDGSDIDITLNGFLGIDGTTGRVGIGDLNPNSRLSVNSVFGHTDFLASIYFQQQSHMQQ